MPRSHTDWMTQALEIAHKALPQDVPVGALLIHEDQLIASAYNQREQKHNPVGHAEILLLQEAGQRLGQWRLENCILYVTLEPCSMCAAAILQARVPHVVFGAYDPLQGACGSHTNVFATTSNTQLIGGILEEPCRDLLYHFFKEKRV